MVFVFLSTRIVINWNFIFKKRLKFESCPSRIDPPTHHYESQVVIKLTKVMEHNKKYKYLSLKEIWIWNMGSLRKRSKRGKKGPFWPYRVLLGTSELGWCLLLDIWTMADLNKLLPTYINYYKSWLLSHCCMFVEFIPHNLLYVWWPFSKSPSPHLRHKC